MRKNKFEAGRRAVKILAVLAVCSCVASLMAGDATVLQGALAIVTLLIFAAIFVVIGVYCRCPHCGRAIYLGLWQKTVCPHCRRHLSSGKKVRGSRS